MNWCFKVEKCFTYRWYINNWEHSSGLSLAIFFSLGCFGNGRSKFWVQGVASAVLMLFWHCFYCDWIAVESGQGFTCVKLTYPEYLFDLMLSWDFVPTVCIYADQLHSMFVMYSIILGERDCDIWPFCLENLLCFIIISHVDTNFKITLTIVCLVSLLNRKVNVSYIFKPSRKRVIAEFNYCSLGIVFELKKGFWALGTACGQGKYEVKWILAYNVLLTVL